MTVVALPGMWLIAPVTAGYTIYDASVTSTKRVETSKELCSDYIDVDTTIMANPITEEDIAAKVCRILTVNYYSDMTRRIERENKNKPDGELPQILSLETKAFSSWSHSNHDEMLEAEQILQKYGLPACPETVTEDLWSKSPTLRELIEFYTDDVLANQAEMMANE